MSSPVIIRRAEQKDLHGIVAIHNQGIAKPYANAYTEPFRPEDRVKWLKEHSGNCPIYVALEGDKITGWLSVGPYRSGRAALSHTKEVSYYIDEAYQKQGIASQLLQYAMSRIKELDAKVYIAIVLDKNIPSIKLLEKNGYTLWGNLPNVAYFNNEPCNHLYYGWLAE